MPNKEKHTQLGNLPQNAADFIKLVIKKMRYRKKVRAEVQAELTAHFEDELKDCTTDQDKEQKARQLIADFGDPKLLAVLLRRAKKRCRPLWRTIAARTLQTTGVLILCLIAYVVWFLSGKPVVTVDYVAQLNRTVQPAADDSLNAAPLYEKAVELYEEKSSDEMSELLGKKYNEATREQKKLIAKWLNDNKEIFDLLIAGNQKPYYWQEYEGKEIVSVLVPNLAGFRKLAYALRWRIWLSANQDRYEDSFNDIKTCYRLGQHLKGDKSLVEQLVGIAIQSLAAETIRDILSEYEINSARLSKLQRDFEQIAANENFIVSLKTEKLLAYDEIQRCFTEDRLGSGHLYIPRVTGLGGDIPTKLNDLLLKVVLSPQQWLGAAHILFLHPNKQQTRDMAERYYARATEMFCKTPAQIRSEGIDFEKETAEMVKGNLLLQILVPAIGRVSQQAYVNKTNVEAILTIIATLRYKQDTGNYPTNLDELITDGYLKQLPIDPFSDRPLVYNKTHDGFTIYSVGLNFTDDGGQYGRSQQGNVALWADNGDAVFWPVTKPTPPKKENKD